eukprot:m.301600 g.301600  ORF g.301600 m.301600 type:complete len:161 (-) comp15879_c0_seq55:267-749(-)
MVFEVMPIIFAVLFLSCFCVIFYFSIFLLLYSFLVCRDFKRRDAVVQTYLYGGDVTQLVQQYADYKLSINTFIALILLGIDVHAIQLESPRWTTYMLNPWRVFVRELALDMTNGSTLYDWAQQQVQCRVQCNFQSRTTNNDLVAQHKVAVIKAFIAFTDA